MQLDCVFKGALFFCVPNSFILTSVFFFLSQWFWLKSGSYIFSQVPHYTHQHKTFRLFASLLLTWNQKMSEKTGTNPEGVGACAGFSLFFLVFRWFPSTPRWLKPKYMKNGFGTAFSHLPKNKEHFVLGQFLGDGQTIWRNIVIWVYFGWFTCKCFRCKFAAIAEIIAGGGERARGRDLQKISHTPQTCM